MADFEKQLLEEYELWFPCIPHFDEWQGTITKQLSPYYDQTLRILEVGTGLGHTAEIILKASPSFTVTSVENNPDIAAIARKRLASYCAAGRLEVMTADAMRYVKDQEMRFHAFVSGYTLHNFLSEERSDFLTDLFTCLTPGAVFVNADKYAHDDPQRQCQELGWQLTTLEKHYANINRPDLAAKWRDHILEDEKSTYLMRESEAIAEMEAAGFVQPHIIYRQHMEAVLVARKPGSLSAPRRDVN
jgi:spermidine synthase